MKRSPSTTPREAPWPPPAPQVASAIFAAVLQGKVTEQEIDAVEGLSPAKFPPELMIKLGFNPPPEDPAAAQAVEELKAMGYPKTDYDPGNGETFPVYPEQIFYDDSHPLSGTLPDNARPETWRELESAEFNPSKAVSIRQPQSTGEEWPPSDESIDSAVVAAIRSGAIGEKEMATIRRTPKSQWPDTLWASLGFPAPAAEKINVRVEIASQGTFHHITRDYYTHPRDGEEFVCFEKIQVSIYDTQAAVEGQERLLRTVTFRQAAGTLGVHGKPPEPPWRGTIDEVGCSSRMERELTLAARGDTPVKLDTRGITIGDHTITWSEVTENGGLDCYYSVTAYGHGIPLDGGLTERLYHGDEMRVGPKRAILAALVDQIDYIVANSPSEHFGRSPVRALDAAADNPNVLIEIVFAMPWERARSILGSAEFSNWLEENHPASPRRPLPSPPKTPSDADEDTPEWPPEWPPDRFRILCAMRAARMAGTMTPQDVERMDQGPPETWPADLWQLLGFSPPQAPAPTQPPITHCNTPLTPGGEVALNALLINLKTQGMLTDEFLPASEGEILLNQPFTEWPPELQEKMAPYGAGPAIR